MFAVHLLAIAATLQPHPPAWVHIETLDVGNGRVARHWFDPNRVTVQSNVVTMWFAEEIRPTITARRSEMLYSFDCATGEARLVRTVTTLNNGSIQRNNRGWGNSVRVRGDRSPHDRMLQIACERAPTG